MVVSRSELYPTREGWLYPLNLLAAKCKDVLYSVLPIVVLVILLNFTLTPLDSRLLARFFIGAALIIIGLAVFLTGVDVGITPIGMVMGGSLVKSNRTWIVAVAGLLLGFVISIAEPDLHVLAGEVEAVTAGLLAKDLLILVVSLGIAVAVSLGLERIVFNFPLNVFFTVTYLLILILGFFTTPEILAISFDASGATTGALTVPFLLALAMGVSRLKKDSKSSEEDSFGLVGIASAGAIIGVMAMSVLSGTQRLTGSLHQDQMVGNSILASFVHFFPRVVRDVTVALLPILLIFLLSQFLFFKLPGKSVRRILFGIMFSFIGLVLFLLGVNAGFMDLGTVVGYQLASLSKVYVIGVGFVLGLVTVLAEPAVYVLTHQIEDVTSGYVKRKVVMLTLCLGMGCAIALSMMRIVVPGLQLWQLLLPGYIIAIAISYFVPGLFVGVAFDSGGVASGPMVATFVLAFAQGVAEATEGADVLMDGFGVIAVVAMTPLIALQVLGLVFKAKSRKEGVETSDS